ncbi:MULTISPECIES: hypothetical protein [unclassified Microcoleus]|uniref:hypothetical protein n=1 Tax=unclassified Microcoleus TaxID=2642155 RepID=UPI001E0E66DE|nr:MULTISPECIES: hypothetical protein [unclassified Microcoleus]MCC3469850.1 hypothetical protein [Microcoleus sp. PH2017_06_SFM_O_A]TAG64549.1 MAG: hypothetical protein EAZ25_19760 [Oscillatoriales cyanobacterium]MCC3412375.1 hypothetical protein [Microcoleus sp. PH2017_02_FOX_O_A]MCC3423587.1 hypothetical protein [Microcoleus sp. PH2017_01_SCD_O_A]MCC3516491.1 hypothetical protein [Microcoleus sp. PH2017_18_LLB_O_A]
MATQNKFPLDWDEQRVRQTIEHYDRQSEDEAVAEDEAAFDSKEQAFVQVPLELLPLVRELIAKHYASV